MLLMHFVGAQPSSEPTASIASVNSPNVYKLNGRMGLQKSLNKLITPAVYDTLYKISPTRYAGKRFNTTKQQAFWGIISASGSLVIPFKYSVLEISESLAIVGLQEQNIVKYGVYSFDGEEIINPNFESVKTLNKQLIAAYNKSKTLVFNRSGVKLMQLNADSISMLGQEFIKYIIRGKVGVSNLHDSTIIPCIYNDIKIDNDAFWVKRFPNWHIIKGYDTLFLNYENVIDWEPNYIVSNGGKSWLINNDDKAISVAYDTIINVNATFSFVRLNAKWGVINFYGEEIIPVIYSHLNNDDEVIYALSSGKQAKWSLFDYYGFRKTKLKYSDFQPISEGRIAIRRNGKWGFIDRYGIEIISPIFDQVKPFEKGLSIVTFYGEDGLINREGDWLAAPSPISISDFDNNRILGKVNGQYQIRSFEGELVYFTGNQLEMTSTGFVESDSCGMVVRNITWIGTYLEYSHSDKSKMTGGAGLIIFEAKGKYGFKDQKGRIIIANRYEAAKPFNQRMAAIKINNKWGFINLDEQLVIQPKYDSVGHFSRNVCITKKTGLIGVVNLKGKEIVPNKYQQIIILSSGKFSVRKNGKWGILDENGAVVIHPKYDQLIPVSQRFYIAERNGKYGTIDIKGVNKIPLQYDFIGYNDKTKTLVTKLSYNAKWAFLRKAHLVNN